MIYLVKYKFYLICKKHEHGTLIRNIHSQTRILPLDELVIHISGGPCPMLLCLPLFLHNGENSQHGGCLHPKPR